MPEPLGQDLGEKYLSLLSPADAIFDTHKTTSGKISKLYGYLEDGYVGFVSGKKFVEFADYSQKISSCGSYLRFVRGDAGKFKLIEARFCKVSNCPMCQWRRSLKWRAKFLTLLPEIQEKYPSHRWLFLTLTIRNCGIDDLKPTIKHLNESFRRLSQLKKFPMIGCVKAVEVTRSWDCFDSFTDEFVGRHGSRWVYEYQKKHNTVLRLEPTNEVHPHLHVVGLVKPSYFSHGYLSHSDWVELWQQSLRVDYVPIVNIKVVKSRKKLPNPNDLESNNNSDDSGMISAICESLKYTVKEQDLTGVMNDDAVNSVWLKQITEQLYKTRKVEYKGCLKELGKQLESAFNDDDLVSVNEEKEKDDNNYSELVFTWYQSLEKYVLKNN